MTDVAGATGVPAGVVAGLGEACVALARGLRDADLARPTPCHGWDVRWLARHWLTSTCGLASTLRTGRLDPDDPWGLARLGPDAELQGSLAASIEDLVEAMLTPGITDGTTFAGLPQLVQWRLALAELGLHAWDLAAATGVPWELDRWTAGALLDSVAAVARGARLEGTFEDPVPAPPGSGPLTRAVALSGRDPGWAPA